MNATRPVPCFHALRYLCADKTKQLSTMATPLTTSATKHPFPNLYEDHPAQELGRLSPTKLLQCVQEASAMRDHPSTQVVFTAFYHRYHRYLAKVVRNAFAAAEIHDDDCINEIVDDALAAFFRASRRCDVTAARDEDTADRIIRAYIGRLAKWKALNARSFQEAFGKSNLDLEEIDDHVAKQDECGARDWMKAEVLPEDPRVEAIVAWMATLTPFQLDVLRTYYLDVLPGRKSGRLPDGVSLSLANKHNVTTSAVRHAKRTLGQEIRTRFEKH